MTWEEARASIKKHLDLMYPYNTPKDVLKVAYEALQQPQVVRCMECMYAMVAPDDNGYFYCKYPFASKAPHESHFYCANGVRKEGDGDG